MRNFNNQADNSTLLITQIEKANIGMLSVICEIVLEIERAYGRIGSSKEWALQFVGEEDLLGIEEILLKKTLTISESTCLLNCREAENLQLLWEYIDKESWDKYIAKTLEIPGNIPKYLLLHARFWHGGKTTGWDFDKEHLEKYIDVDNAYQRILSLKNTPEFSILQHRFKQITIAYCIWYEQEIKDRHQISEERINHIIPEWEHMEG